MWRRTGGDDSVLRLNPSADSGNVCDSYRCVVDRCYDDTTEIFGSLRLAANQRELQLVILFNQTRRDDDVRILNRIDDLLTRNIVRDQSIRIDLYMKLACFAAGDTNDGHARQTRQPWPDGVQGYVS